MNPSTQSLSIQIVRFVDHRFPGWVACEFVDANSLRHVLIDKVPIFTTELLDAASSYPLSGSAPCEVLARWQDTQQRELVHVTLALPVGMESTEGVSEFVVVASQPSNLWAWAPSTHQRRVPRPYNFVLETRRKVIRNQ